MRKTPEITKYCIEWQMIRLSCKSFKSVDQKVHQACTYLYKYNNVSAKERVQNYLEGLCLGYKDDASKKFVKAAIEYVKDYPVSNDIITNTNLSLYTNKEINALAADLMVRVTKWLSNGYRNTELLDFITCLYVHTNNTPKLDKLNMAISASKLIPNTHKFMF